MPRARPECGQIAMLIRDGRRRSGSAARVRWTDGRTGSHARSPPSSIGAVAAFGSQIYGGDSEQRRQLGDRKRRNLSDGCNKAVADRERYSAMRSRGAVLFTFLPAATLGAVRSTGARWSMVVSPVCPAMNYFYVHDILRIFGHLDIKW